MSYTRFFASVVLALAVHPGAETASAATRMVGVVPSDGVAMLVKSFSVSAGTTILGVEFENNDPRTTFPDVVLVRGASSAIADGMLAARTTEVSETASGWVRVLWSQPVQVVTADVYYVGVRIPEGPGKQGPGNGPALGATDVSRPNGSFLASGAEGTLMPVGVDLTMNLLASGIGKATQPTPEPEEHGVLRTFLGASVPNPSASVARIDFGVERTQYVRLSIYDVTGREVRRLAEGTLAAGTYSQAWDGRDRSGRNVGAGVYIAKLQAGDDVITQKVVVTR